MKKADWILIGSVFVLIVVTFLLFILRPQVENAMVFVFLDGSEYARYELLEDSLHVIQTDYGTNEIQIQNGYVSVVSSNCPEQICVHHKKIHLSGETIVCLPHKLVVTIEEPHNDSLPDIVI